MYEVMKTHCTK